MMVQSVKGRRKDGSLAYFVNKLFINVENIFVYQFLVIYQYTNGTNSVI